MIDFDLRLLDPAGARFSSSVHRVCNLSAQSNNAHIISDGKGNVVIDAQFLNDWMFGFMNVVGD